MPKVLRDFLGFCPGPRQRFYLWTPPGNLGLHATIGNASGKTATRPKLTAEEIAENTKTYYDQYCLILDPAKTRVVFNSE